MHKGQNADGRKIGAPNLQRDGSAHPVSLPRQHPRHRHQQAGEEKHAMPQHQPLQPPVRPVPHANRQPDKKRRQSHHPIPEQIIIKEQSALPIVQHPHGLLIQRIQPDSRRLRKIDQEHQNRINRRKPHPGISRRPMPLPALRAEAAAHHHVSNGQQHTHKIVPKIPRNQHKNRKKHHGTSDNQGPRPCHGPIRPILQPPATYGNPPPPES